MSIGYQVRLTSIYMVCDGKKAQTSPELVSGQVCAYKEDCRHELVRANMTAIESRY